MGFASHSRQVKHQNLCMLIRNGAPNKTLPNGDTLPTRRGVLARRLFLWVGRSKQRRHSLGILLCLVSVRIRLYIHRLHVCLYC